MARRLFSVSLASSVLQVGAIEVECPGTVNLTGFGRIAVVPTGWAAPNESAPVYTHDNVITATYGSRAYWADGCTAGKYDHKEYLALNLVGKTMRYTSDLSGLGCGCNAAFYLTSMHQNTQASECSDYYCDANDVCGQSCAEIDIQEANQRAWHSTLHTTTDHSGLGMGIGGGGSGWSGPRDWTVAQYGPGGQCIDTTSPFQVAVSFPAGPDCNLQAMTVTLTQKGHDCPLSVTIGNYAGMGELSAALKAGMTPIVSYWGAADMLWMDGKGQDQQGGCQADSPDNCRNSTRFYDFSVEDIPANKDCGLKLTDQRPAQPKTTTTATTTATREPQAPAPVWRSLTAPGVCMLVGGVVAACVLALFGLSLARRRRMGVLVEPGAMEVPRVPADDAGLAFGEAGLQHGRPSSQGLLALASGGARQVSSNDLRMLAMEGQGQP